MLEHDNAIFTFFINNFNWILYKITVKPKIITGKLKNRKILAFKDTPINREIEDRVIMSYQSVLPSKTLTSP